MVWSQYVDEANIGFDAYVSDDDEHANEHTPLNIEDWKSNTQMNYGICGM